MFRTPWPWARLRADRSVIFIQTDTVQLSNRSSRARRLFLHCCDRPRRIAKANGYALHVTSAVQNRNDIDHPCGDLGAQCGIAECGGSSVLYFIGQIDRRLRTLADGSVGSASSFNCQGRRGPCASPDRGRPARVRSRSSRSRSRGRQKISTMSGA